MKKKYFITCILALVISSLYSQIVITQYYEGISLNKWAEIKNVSGAAIPANTYYIARFNNARAVTPSGEFPNQSLVIPAMAIDEVIVYKHPLASAPADPLGVTIVSSFLPDVNGDDILVVSTTNDTTCYDNRIDMIGVGGVFWGINTSFVRTCGIATPNVTYTPSEWVEFTLDEVNTPVALDANVALGVHSFTPTTFDATNTWDSGTPDRSREAIVDQNYFSSISGSFEACSLDVMANRTLRIQNSDYVRVTNDITIDGEIAVGSEANLVQVNDLASVILNGTGVGTIQKTTTLIDAFYEYTYWSSPFVSETIGEAGSGLDLVLPQRIFEYDAINFEDVSPADGFDDDGNDWSVASGVMVPGKGYAAFAQSNGLPFPQNQTYTFDGQFNNGVITTPITISSAATDPNWNFLGNPYPSGISAIDFIEANPDLAGTLYFWTHNSPPEGVNPGPSGLNFSVDDYASYNYMGGIVTSNPAISGGTAPTDIIASGQGFFVEALNAGTATFNNSMRVTTGNDNFYRALDRIWLNFENDYAAFSQILIGFTEDATLGVDRLYDGKRLDAGSYISFFTMIDDEDYAIQGRPALTEEETIPLGFKNLVEGVNEYKISIGAIEGLLENSEVFLKDNLLGVSHDLNEGEYRFTSEQGVYRERFELLLINTFPVSDAVENELLIEKNENDRLLFSTSNGSEIASIQLFDILGRLIYDSSPKPQEEAIYIVDVNFKTTLFIAKVTLADGKVLTKKALN